MVRRRTLSKLTPYLFLILPLIIYLIWVIGPMFYTFYLSLTDWDGLSTPNFIGWRNYQRLFKDPVFYISLKNNLTVRVFRGYRISREARAGEWLAARNGSVRELLA